MGPCAYPGGRGLLPPERSDGGQHCRDDEGEEVESKLHVPRVERSGVGEAVYDREDQQSFPCERLQEVAERVKCKCLAETRAKRKHDRVLALMCWYKPQFDALRRRETLTFFPTVFMAEGYAHGCIPSEIG